MSRDKLTIARSFAKAAVPTGGEVSSANAVCIPPGMYDVEVQYGATTGAPTGATFNIQESGYLFNDLTHTIAGFADLVDPRARTIATPTTTGRFFLRGVRITRWADGAVNAGVAITLAGGTTPTLTATQVTFWGDGRAANFNGQP